MKIRREDVRRVAELARLALTPDEEEALVVELGAILAYVEKLDELDTEGVTATANVHEAARALRVDEVHNLPEVEILLANAPDRWRDFFRVPKVIE
jgi:aspartyl-tRNA(Asn)/glutamyl-tRNA(Gln) amidotransferase subunit C